MSNRRVIFFDDEPNMGGRFKESLLKQGYVVVEPKSIDEALHEIDGNGAGLLIHFAHSTETQWKICDAVYEKHPQFPSIHFASGEKSEEYHSKLVGPFHYKMRHLLPEKAFLKHVRKLFLIGRLILNKDHGQEALHFERGIQDTFKSLEAPQFQSDLVRYLNDAFKAENALYMPAGAFNYYLDEKYKVTQLHAVSERNRVAKPIVVS
jgi:hypothetical protein